MRDLDCVFSCSFLSVCTSFYVPQYVCVCAFTAVTASIGLLCVRVCVCVCVRAASVAVFDIYTMIDVQPERSAPPPHPSSSFSGVSRSRL